MSWRDFLYYSKGERRGLIVLLCLITIAGILLLLNNMNENYHVTEKHNNNISNKPNNSNETSNINDQSVQGQKNSNPKSTISNTDSKIISENNSSKVNSINSSTGKTDSKTTENKESVSERVERLTSYSRPSYIRTEKFSEGTVVELNSADTTILKKVPGIGSTFAKRIISYRNLLGGFYSVTQLSEVYGIDEDRYTALEQWFTVNPNLISKTNLNNISQDSLNRHPYINYSQSRVIMQIRRQKGKLTGWENLQLLNEFNEADKIRLQYYLSFE